MRPYDPFTEHDFNELIDEIEEHEEPALEELDFDELIPWDEQHLNDEDEQPE